MRNERTRIGFIPVVLAIFSMTLLGGCTLAGQLAGTDPAGLETFVAGLLRNAAAALLL